MQSVDQWIKHKVKIEHEKCKVSDIYADRSIDARVYQYLGNELREPGDKVEADQETDVDEDLFST